MKFMQGLKRRLVPRPPTPHLAFQSQDQTIIDQVRPFTMTSPERVVSVLDAVDYIIQRKLPGAFAECGVWRGGSVLAMILRLQALGVDDRDIYLYDTFEGMTAPTKHDVSNYSENAQTTWEKAKYSGQKAWNGMFSEEVFNLDTVRNRLLATGYPSKRMHFIKGPVEQTLPDRKPEDLALLRLDTDWYESTRHELEILYPILQPGGVLIIDDYGHWEGCRRAVDEFFAKPENPSLLLNRVDYTGRMAIKA